LNLLLKAPQAHLLHQELELIEVRRTIRHPAVVVAVGVAVALGERDEAPRGRMTDAAQKNEGLKDPSASVPAEGVGGEGLDFGGFG
jgi:hypothetical protein